MKLLQTQSARQSAPAPDRAEFALVQRLGRQLFARPNAGAFDARFRCDYMGSSEFEWGAVPQAMKEIRKVKHLTIVEHPVELYGTTLTVYFVGERKHLAAQIDDFERWAYDEQRPFRAQELTHFPEQFAGKPDEYYSRTIAWWSLRDAVMWTLDADIAQQLVDGIQGVPVAA